MQIKKVKNKTPKILESERNQTCTVCKQVVCSPHIMSQESLQEQPIRKKEAMIPSKTGHVKLTANSCGSISFSIDGIKTLKAALTMMVHKTNTNNHPGHYYHDWTLVKNLPCLGLMSGTALNHYTTATSRLQEWPPFWPETNGLLSKSLKASVKRTKIDFRKWICSNLRWENKHSSNFKKTDHRWK